MTTEEQQTIFGEVDAKNICAITRLRTREGEEAQGYGKWPKDKSPYGEDKGNTKANMAFIRSERNAFGRLFTDAIPQNVEIVDEAYVEGIGEVDKRTGEIIEGEVREIEEQPEAEVKPKGKAKAKAPVKAEEAEETDRRGLFERQGRDLLKEATQKSSSAPLAEEELFPASDGKDTTPITEDQIIHVTDLMKEAGMDMAAMGKSLNVEKKWGIRKLKDLVRWQYDELVLDFQKK